MIDLLIKKQELLKRHEDIQNQLEDIQKQIDAQPQIEPVFSGDLGVCVLDAEIDANLSLWQEARARVIEKINIANKGDNGFKAGENNYCIFLEYVNKNKSSKLLSRGHTRSQDVEPMLYIRTWKAAQELLKDHQFCEDMRTYFKGWL